MRNNDHRDRAAGTGETKDAKNPDGGVRPFNRRCQNLHPLLAILSHPINTIPPRSN